MPSKNLYDSDFYQWSQQQSYFFKSGQWNEFDIANLAEEIEDIGKSLKRELEGRLKGLLVHLEVEISARVAWKQLALQH